MSELETRAFEAAANIEDRTITGIAVPYGQDANIGTYMERFAPGAISNVEDVKLFYGHEEPIGKVISGRETDAGYEITAKISDTPKGNEVRTLLADGVLNKFSVGFVPVTSERDGNTVIRTAVNLKEVSVVPFPAFSQANITEVREESQPIPEQETPNMENIELDVRTMQDEVAELRRTIEAQTTQPAVETAPEFRSAAEALKAIAAGDETAIRAYSGATTADSVLINGWVGDLTRIVDQAAILANVFGSGTLPGAGNFVEYAELLSNSSSVTVQAAEGNDLAYGEIALTTQTAPVKTLGGYTTMTRQTIERSSVNYLDHALRAQAVQVGKAKNTLLRTAYSTAVGAQITAGDTVLVPATGATYADWLGAITDAAVKFQDRGLSLDALIVDTATFKALAALEGADGRPVLLVTGAGNNNVGTINVVGLAGSLANIPVVLDPLLDGEIAFVNSQAIRVYGSPAVSLQHENIINLSKDFSVYTYTAIATEIPDAIIPVEFVV